MAAFGVTLSRHIIEEEHRHPATTGEFSVLLQQISYAGRVLAHEIGKVALGDNVGSTGHGPSGDRQKKIDVYANQVVREAFVRSRLVAGIASEEMEQAEELSIAPEAKYLLCLDPIDGSANAEVNAPLGTIFGIFRRKTTGQRLAEEDFLRPGRELAAAGYVLYGPSTMLVYTVGEGVHGFTLDRGVGEFILSHPDLRCPPAGRIYTANTGRYGQWDKSVQRFIDHINEHDPATGRPYALRYGGAPVADVHRSLTTGGVFLYPADADYPNGKLRLLYEAAPLALIAEQAGGAASTGAQRVLDVRPDSIHDTTPIVVGSRDAVALYDRFMVLG